MIILAEDFRLCIILGIIVNIPVGLACLVIMTVVSKRFKPLADDEGIDDDDGNVN